MKVFDKEVRGAFNFIAVLTLYIRLLNRKSFSVIYEFCNRVCGIFIGFAPDRYYFDVVACSVHMPAQVLLYNLSK